HAALTLVATVVERDEPGLAPSALGVIEGKRVLVVDDHAFGREVLATLFRTWRMQPIEAAAPRTALELADGGTRVDLVIVDYFMPETDGVELARAIAGRPGTREAPVVLMSTAAG